MRRWLRVRRVRRLKVRSNSEWIEVLQAQNPDGLQDLRSLLVEAIWPVLRNRVPAQAAALAEDMTQDAVLLVLDRHDSFRGESQFTTWAAKVAVRLALSELRRLRWKDVSLDELLEDRPQHLATAVSENPSPEEAMMTTEQVDLMQDLVSNVLTERQQLAIKLVMIHGMPLEEAANRLDTNRNALYKLLHDARQRLKKALEERGFSPDDILPDT